MFDKMSWLQANHDDLRLRMVREPRGYPAANCNLILPSNHPEADAGYVIMEQVEYPGMSGTNTMCVVTVLLETGMLPMIEPVTELALEAPAGLIRVTAACRDGKVTGVTFRNVPAFATHLDVPVEVPQLGTVTVDVAYGGMFYVIADAEPFGLSPDPGRGRRHHPDHRDDQGGGGATSSRSSIRTSPGSPGSPSASCPVRPTIRRTAGGTWSRSRRARWTGNDRRPGPARSTARRAAPGTSAKMATLAAKGRLAVGDEFRHEGILGTVFTGRVLEEATIGPYRAIVPSITGQAWITGFANTSWTRPTRSPTASRSGTSGASCHSRPVVGDPTIEWFAWDRAVRLGPALPGRWVPRSIRRRQPPPTGRLERIGCLPATGPCRGSRRSPRSGGRTARWCVPTTTAAARDVDPRALTPVRVSTTDS